MKEELSVVLTAPVKDECDILIVGGGPSGVAAAISSARLGKKVILLEQSGQLGGMSTLGGVAVFMYVGNVMGIFRDICEKVIPDSLNAYLEAQADYYAPQFNPLLMRYSLMDMALKNGVKIYFHTKYVSPDKDGDTVKGVTAVTREGLVAFKSKIVIDCTGDGRVAIDAGAEFETGRSEDGLTQPGTLMFQMQNTGKKVNRYLPEGCPKYRSVDDLPQGRVLKWERNTDGTLLVNMTRVKGNGALAEDSNMLEIESLKQVFSVADYLQDNGYENYILSNIAAQTGVRETNRIVGLYTLSDDDITGGAKFNDVVAQTKYGVDIHSPSGEKQTKQIEVNRYDIPYRVMIPKGVKGIFVSGRAVSASHVAMSSLRVMPTCFALGQAAGIAAAICCTDRIMPEQVDINKLHDEMKNQGVIFQ